MAALEPAAVIALQIFSAAARDSEPFPTPRPPRRLDDSMFGPCKVSPLPEYLIPSILTFPLPLFGCLNRHLVRYNLSLLRGAIPLTRKDMRIATAGKLLFLAVALAGGQLQPAHAARNLPRSSLTKSHASSSAGAQVMQWCIRQWTSPMQSCANRLHFPLIRLYLNATRSHAHAVFIVFLPGSAPAPQYEGDRCSCDCKSADHQQAPYF